MFYRNDIRDGESDVVTDFDVSEDVVELFGVSADDLTFTETTMDGMTSTMVEADGHMITFEGVTQADTGPVIRVTGRSRRLLGRTGG